MITANYSLGRVVVRDSKHLVKERKLVHSDRLALENRVIALGRGLHGCRARNRLHRSLLPACSRLTDFLVLSLFAGFLRLPHMGRDYVDFLILSKRLLLLVCKLKDVLSCLIGNRLLMPYVLRLGVVMLICRSFKACDCLPRFVQAVEPTRSRYCSLRCLADRKLADPVATQVEWLVRIVKHFRVLSCCFLPWFDRFALIK